METRSPIDVQMPTAQSLYLRMYFNEEEISCGTGFVVKVPDRRPILVTNRHNLSGRRSDNNLVISKLGAIPNRLVISHHKSERPGEWVDISEPLLDADGSPLWYEHPSLGSRADIAALSLTQFEGVSFYPYGIDDFEDVVAVTPADPVSIVGFPFGIRSGGSFAVWATGFIATEIMIDHAGLPIFLVDCRARKGQSGSPVIVYRKQGTWFPLKHGFFGHAQQGFARLLGIYAGRINEESDLGIVWKASAIMATLNSIPVLTSIAR